MGEEMVREIKYMVEYTKIEMVGTRWDGCQA